MSAENVEANRKRFEDAWTEADGSGDALDAVLAEILDIEVKSYRMTVRTKSPSKSIKNKLGQANTVPGGLLCLTIRGPEGVNERAERMLIEKWRTNAGWEEFVASVALVEERDGKPHITVVIEREPTENGARVKERLFPEVTLRRTEPFGAEVLPAGALQDLSSLASSLFVSESWLNDVAWLLEDKQRVVFYGPPGTGKSYLALAIARFLQPNAALRRVVQLHPSYGYEDFFEGYRPVKGSKDGLALDIRQGPFGGLVEAAREAAAEPAVLLLDEMNRGNLPRVFGELYFLLEHEEESARLMYRPDESFVLPQNLYMIGTMNTADRSVAQLDQALRRRFHFVPLFPGEPPVDVMLRGYLAKNVPAMSWVADLLDKANQALGDRNVAIGPSHLMRDDLDEEVLDRIWRHSVLPTIEDHFFGEQDRAKDFELEALRRSFDD